MKFVLRTSEVKFALNFAVRRNFTHKVNFTIEDNFTCPKGKLSFSVFSVKDNTLNVALIFRISKQTRSARYLAPLGGVPNTCLNALLKYSGSLYPTAPATSAMLS